MRATISLLRIVSLVAAFVATVAHGQIYVADYAADEIYKFDSNGHYTPFAGTANFQPQYLAFDAQGNLYASIVVGNLIQKFDSHGNASVFANSGLSQPESLAFDKSGNLYVANMADNQILKYDSSGHSTVFSTFAINAAIGLAFDSNGTLYGALGGANQILKFDSLGNYTVLCNAPSCYNLAVGPDGMLYAADSGTEIWKITPQGVLSPFATGSTQGGMAFDSSGNLYTVQYNQITRYDPQGHSSVFATGPSSFLSGIAIQPVPEPGVGSMLALGLCMFIADRFKQSMKK